MMGQVRSLILFNRLLLLFTFTLSASYVAWVEPSQPAPFPWLALGTLGLTNGLGLILNEVIYGMLRRIKADEFSNLAALSIFLPIATMGIVAINYLLSGNLMVYMMGILALLQAHFLGCFKLSRLLMVGQLGLLMIGVWLNLPSLELFKEGPWLVAHVGILLLALQWMGSVIAKFVQHHSLEVDKLQSIATTDILTGLTNRREFNSRLNGEIARARRYNTPLSLALFDIDNFKKLNDRYGHQVGDRILKEMGQMLRQNVRESDVAARYGGEEFALILPETSELEAYELLERIRTLISQKVFCLPENPLTITISIGVSQLNPKHYSSFEFVELADMALYEAKKQGKNQVIQGSTLLRKTVLDKTFIG